jgi:hypothetical protein
MEGLCCIDLVAGIAVSICLLDVLPNEVLRGGQQGQRGLYVCAALAWSGCNSSMAPQPHLGSTQTRQGRGPCAAALSAVVLMWTSCMLCSQFFSGDVYV